MNNVIMTKTIKNNNPILGLAVCTTELREKNGKYALYRRIVTSVSDSGWHKIPTKMNTLEALKDFFEK